MSDNPFSTPQGSGIQGSPMNPAGTVPPSVPGALTVILIFCLILGIMGLLGTCATGVYLAFQSSLEKMIVEGPGAIEQKEFQRLNLAVSKKAMMPGLVLSFVNLIVAAMLIIGSVGALRGKESGRGLLRIALLAAIFYGILKIIAAVYSYFVTISGLEDAVANYQGEADPAALETMLQFGKIGGIIGLVMGIIIPLAILGFYVWARGYLNKDQVVKYFASKG